MSNKANETTPSASESTADASEAMTPTKRRRSRKEARKSSPQSGGFLQRYRGVLVAVLVVVVIGVVGFFFLRTATASTYTCGSLLTPTSPQAFPLVEGADDDQLGFAVEDYGRLHDSGTIDYPTCPPTSGSMSPSLLPRQFYGPESVQAPNGWMHTLEHGYAVIAYRGDPGEETLAQLQTAMEAAEPSEVAVQCGLPNKVLALRFDEMSTPFAVLAWDKALLMETFDLELMTTAAQQFQDQAQAPEAGC